MKINRELYKALIKLGFKPYEIEVMLRDNVTLGDLETRLNVIQNRK